MFETLSRILTSMLSLMTRLQRRTQDFSMGEVSVTSHCDDVKILQLQSTGGLAVLVIIKMVNC